LAFRRALLLGGAIALTAGALPGRCAAQASFILPSESANRRFGIFYKGDKVGVHTVSNSPETGETRVNTEIVILVKALFLTVFSFSHTSEERWRDGKLNSLKSETVEHGETLQVEGAAMPQGFRVMSKGGQFIAPSHALTSNSLWSLAILDQETVIDAQHGGIIGISKRRLPDERIVVLGRPILASRYRFITPYLAGSIWYDGGARWVAGEFERDGAQIAYRLEA
jgi:hypothetical protein